MTPKYERVLLVSAHPVADSFVAAAWGRTITALTAAGHTVDHVDLYAEHFDPVLREHEWRAQLDRGVLDADTQAHIARLKAAQAIVFVYPTWFGGLPAILKGWLDRVWVEGVAFHLDSRDRPRPGLTSVRRLVVVTTHGSSRLVNAAEGEPGKRLVRRWLRITCHPLARSRWIAMYDVDRADAAARTAFLDRVEREMHRF